MIGLLHEHLAHEAGAEALRSRSAKARRLGRRRLGVASLATAAALLIAGPAHASSTDPATFAPHADSASGEVVGSVAAADFDRDGYPDAVAVDAHRGTVSIARGLGNGSFAAPVSPPSGSSGLAKVAVGDFNGDGKVDVAVTARDLGKVGVWLGGGDGTLSGPAYYSTGDWPSDVKAADLNGDDKLDLVVPNYSSNTVTVLVGNGDGTFVPDGYYNTLSQPTSVAVGDVDGDGNVDVAVGSAYLGDVQLFHGVGDGTLGPSTSRPIAGLPTSIAIADFNGDGQGDIAVATRGPLAVFITENGSLPEHGVAYAAAGQYTESIAAGDLNGDGVTDLAVVDAGADVASVWLGDGDGAFAARRDFTTAHNPLAVALADLDRDGRLDLLTGSLNVVSGLLNNTALKPAAATGAASDVTQTGATLNGAINTRARQTQFRYEWGTSSAYGQSMSWHDAGAGDSPVLAPVSIGGLQPGTQYHYRLVANNAAGHAEGQDRTFTTASAPPPSADLALALTGPASVHEGDEISYQLTATNNGPDAATGVVVTDPLPDGASFVAAKSSPSCAEAAETVTCQVGALANGGQAAIDIVVAPARSGRLANTAYVTAVEPDRDTSNGNATVRTTVEAAPVKTVVPVVQEQPQPQPQSQPQEPGVQPSPQSPDLKRPTLSLRIPARISKRQALQGFRITAGCDERCSLRFGVTRVHAEASLALGEGVRAVTVRPCATGSHAARSKCRAALRSSLARVRSIRTKVTIVAVDANGNRTKQTRTITIR
jgi:uncharacterized repeat protein (TIGR01451 family)